MARVQAGENLAEVALELGVDRRGLGAVAGVAGSGDAANGPATGEGAGGASGAVEEGGSLEGTGGGFVARRFYTRRRDGGRREARAGQSLRPDPRRMRVQKAASRKNERHLEG